ncbi:MAG: putative transposase [Gammaproteobacteria bacterium]|jgi:putative transposase
MARLPRYYIKNQPQHIIQRGIDQQDIFFDDVDYQYYLDCLYAAAYNNNLQIHAYVLMPDHVHLLASPGEEKSISKTLQSLGRNYVQHFNDNYENEGTLWEGRYRATVLDPAEYLLKCSRYIELNPVRSGLVKNPKDYKWSSYSHNALAREDDTLTEHRVYKQLGSTDKERSKAYRDMFKTRISDDEIETITNATNKGWALGNEKFVKKIETASNRRATPLPKGRPKKSQS